MPNTKQWIDPDGQITNTGTNTQGIYLIDPVTQLAISPAQASGGDAVTIADGADVAEGSTTDAPSSNTVIGQLKGILLDTADIETNTQNIPPLGQTVMAGSTPVTMASNQTAIPVSGTVTTTPPSNASTNLTQVGGANISEGQTTMANSLPVAVASDNGLATASNQTTGNSSLSTIATNTTGVAKDSSVNGLLLSQGSTTSGQNGILNQAAVSSSSPSYTTGQTSPLSMTTSGGLRAAQSGNWTVLPGNTPNTTAWLVKEQAVSTFFIAAGTAGNTVVKGTPGQFYGVFASTIGAGGGLIYDNATTNSGTPVGAAPTAVGFDQGVPAAGVNCVNGITVAGSATNPALTVFYL